MIGDAVVDNYDFYVQDGSNYLTLAGTDSRKIVDDPMTIVLGVAAEVKWSHTEAIRASETHDPTYSVNVTITAEDLAYSFLLSDASLLSDAQIAALKSAVAAKDPEWTLMNAASALDLADEEEFGGVVVAESFGIKSGAWTVDLGEVWLEFADYAADKPVYTLTGKEVVDFKFSDYYTMAWYALLVSDETAWEHYGDTQAAARTNFVNFLQDEASGNAEDSYTTPFFRKDGANFCLDFAEAETYDPDSPVEVEPEVVYYEWTPGVKTTIVTYTASEVQILAE